MQERMLPLLNRIRLSASLQREVLDLAEDLAAISESNLETVFNQPEILAIADAPGLSAFQKGDIAVRASTGMTSTSWWPILTAPTPHFW
jgi:hypothetical protein